MTRGGPRPGAGRPRTYRERVVGFVPAGTTPRLLAVADHDETVSQFVGAATMAEIERREKLKGKTK